MNFRVRPVRRLAGECEVPGDKSISHRAALLGALADGPTEVQGYLEGEDCLRTLIAIQAMGVEVTKKGPGHYRIAGVGCTASWSRTTYSIAATPARPRACSSASWRASRSGHC